MSTFKVTRLGEVITANSIPVGIAANNINGPTVFKRPNYFPAGPEWIMYFAHHKGNSIRQATATSVEGPWQVLPETILELSKIPGHDHIASPEVVLHETFLELYYHCPYRDSQYTFIATTHNGIDWEYNPAAQGMFYMRILEKDYAIAKYKNEGGIIYRRSEGAFKEVKRILPNMRHCAYMEGKLYWSCIGDSPETIFRGDLDLTTFTVSNIEEVLKPLYNFETGGHTPKPSLPGPATRVNEVRDPYVVKQGKISYIFYTVRGEEAIALAKIEE